MSAGSSRAVRIAALLAVAALLVAFRGAVLAWFTGRPVSPAVAAPPAAGGRTAAAPAGEIAYYTCSMHTSVRQQRPGKCPLCGMQLVAVRRDVAASSVVVLDDGRRQEIGIRTGLVERRRLSDHLHATGRVAFDDSRLADITVKVAGFVGYRAAGSPRPAAPAAAGSAAVAEPTASAGPAAPAPAAGSGGPGPPAAPPLPQIGQRVRRGQILFTLYSPELYLAELDYLAAIASQRAARQTSAPDRADYLVAAAAQRLRLADVDEGEINRLNESGLAAREIPIRSPQGGVVIEKDIVAGAAVQPGMKLLRIAGMERVWVEAAVYQADLPRVGIGQRATVRLPAQPELQLAGRVALVAPLLEPASRTAQVRIELANPLAHGAPVLLPNMSVEIDLATAGAEALVVPEGAVLSTGARTLVFVDEGGGRYRQREVRLGPRLGDGYTVLAGLAADDRVVTAGQFLLDAEVRIRGAGAGPGG